MTSIMCCLLQVAPLWFMAQFTFNTSLSRTTVSSNTILASTASLVTYMMSCLLLGEAFLVVKLASILVCMAGQQSKCLQSPSNVAVNLPMWPHPDMHSSSASCEGLQHLR